MTRYAGYAALLYFLFVIYGSLVPLTYKPMPFADALNHFRAIRYLDLGIGSRADWIANILLYIPLAFLGVAAISGFRHPLIRILLTAIVLVGCLATAVSIEFAQLFFPPRTVSINDLIAETIGTLLGIFIWLFFGQYLLKLYRQVLLGSLISAQAAVIFYLLIYLILSFFPYDFVTSFPELDAKLASNSVNLFLSPDIFNENSLRGVIKLLIEILILMPLGALFCLLLPYSPNKLLLSVLIGFFLGVLIEGVQVFLFSGVAQGFSVITRMVGMGLGATVFNWAIKQKIATWRRFFRPAVFLSIVPYIALIIGINGGLDGTWLTTAAAVTKLTETHFLPLYYFYYTTETVALTSLLSNIGSYSPIGVLYWLYACRTSEAAKTHWLVVGLTAAIFAILIETGKLFLADKHADPSDVLIAFIAAAGAYTFMQRVSNWVNHEKTVTVKQPYTVDSPLLYHADNAPKPQPRGYKINKNTAWISVCLLATIIWTLSRYPLGSAALSGFLVLYGIVLWRFPVAWLLVLPALLPVMDFAPWTGWFFFDEFDLVILSTLALYFFRKPIQASHSVFSSGVWFLLALFGVFYLISLSKGLLPLAPIDSNAFNNYYSNYNSLRIAKGVIWAFLLLPLWQQTFCLYPQSRNYFGYGILLGLTAVSSFAMVERTVFPGLLDFATDYRINVLFSTMHTGGGHIESYLALSLPFIILLFFNRKHPIISSLYGIILFASALYTLLATFSRGGYIALGVCAIVLIIALLVRYKNRLAGSWQPYLLATVLIALIPAIAIPVFNGTLIQQRFSVAEQDKNIRTSHWQDAIAMMDNTVSTTLFGMGLGSYPRTFFWLNNENSRPATYKIETETGNQHLQLRAGDSLFIGQYVTTEPQTDYRLIMDLRSAGDRLALSSTLCEKSLQYSFRCSSVDGLTDGQDWTHSEQVINTGEVGAKSADIAFGWLRRPVQLSLYNGNGAGKIIDIDNIRLVGPSGKNLLANGDFSKGTDFWFFSTEKHNPWHIFNLWVHVLFDMGWLGVGAFFLLFAKAIYSCYVKLRQQDSFAAILLAAFSGFMVVGLVDSPFDAPRLTLLFFLLLFLAFTTIPKAQGLNSARKTS
ncbi:MAG: VanZ family protein [Methylovulum sp.]|nr:VanZ family protein [Methylovulum sp.]